MKAVGAIRESLYARKVAAFLQSLDASTLQARHAFLNGLGDEDAQARFGETVLLLLERADDMMKPRFIARIFTAHIEGHFDYAFAMRLAKMVDRSYAADLPLLGTFTGGVQEEGRAPQTESLFSVGFLSQGGMDGGSAVGYDGGIIYAMNEYGMSLRDHVLNGFTF